MDSTFLINVATSIGFQLPWLISALIVLVLLLGTAGTSGPRRMGIIAAALLCGMQAIHLLTGIYQAWLFADAASRDDAGSSMTLQLQALSALGFVASCVSAVALVMLGVALSRTLRLMATPPPLS